MIEIRAKTLEEAYKKVTKELGVSIVDLDIEIVQNPSSGFLGLFAKDAIIKASPKGQNRVKSDRKPQEKREKDSKKEKITQSKNIDLGSVKLEIKEGIDKLLEASCFDIKLVDLKVDEEEVFIKLDGDDVALLIGKEGYRYKALSYILHNWIKIKYDLNISLEIAEFLKNQEEMIEKYLVGIKEKVRQNGKAQTKPLDGILVKIALAYLREDFPDKYVAIRTLRDGRKIVVVNEFKKGDS